MPFILLDPSAAAAAPATTIGDPLTSVGETLLSLREELVRQLGNRTDLLEGGNDRANLFINQSYIDLATSLRLEELQASLQLGLVADQPLYSLPDHVVLSINMLSILDLTNTVRGGRPLDKIDRNYYRKIRAWKAEPLMFFREGNMVVVWPTPEKVHTAVVDFRIRPQLLSQDTHSPVLPYEWHEAILLGAKAKAFSGLLEYDKAAITKNELVSLVRSKLDSAAEETEDSIHRSSVPQSDSMLRWRQPLIEEL